MKEQELAQKAQEIMPTPTVIPSQKFDLKSTIISGGGGAPVLLVSAGVFQQNFRLNKPTMTIGRGAINDIVIPEQTVSTKHATITIENGSFFLNDLGSTNGTFVNGSRIDKKLLKAGDIIKFGAANCRFEI
jgi:pSer/pThr/pTyr-binding forkhead associated (FHA) protein